MQADMEEGKAEVEIAELQKKLHGMQSQVEESREAAGKAIEASTRRIDALAAEVERLEALLLKKEEAIDAAKKEKTDAQKRHNELLKKVEEYETKIEQLQDTVQRGTNQLEEKLASLDSENQVLRQQAVATSQTSGASRTSGVGNFLTGETNFASENQNLLIKSISQDLGFTGGRPIAACLIYKCLLHWRSFEVERTNIFDSIIEAISLAIEVQDNMDTLSYWLSNLCTLLLLLQQTLNVTGAALTPQRQRSPSSLLRRMSQGISSSPRSAGLLFLSGGIIGGLSDVDQVEAKYPALLFKQQLTAFLQKIYGMIRDNLKKDISSFLALCIQAPRTSRMSLVKGSHSQANVMDQQALIAHWQSIVKILTNYLNTLKANHVPPVLARQVFRQGFSFVNVQLFNSLLLRRECCSFSNGEYLKAGLSELEQWCYSATEECAGSSWDELKHVRQTVGFLVIHQKPEKTLDEITNELCPVLSIQQLYRISTMYWDDKYGTHSVSSEVISSMRVMMAEDSNSTVSSSFLLDDDTSVPFSMDEIFKSMQEIEIPNIDLPTLVRQNSGFAFLLQTKE